MIARDSYVLGDRAPARVEEPPDAAAVASLLTETVRARGAVTAFGGGTLQGIGNAPSRYTCALSLRRIDRVRDYEPRDLTIGVDAGMTLADVARTLARNRQFIPFDAPLPAHATIGGTLASAWAGPRRGAYGRLRDLVIGSTVALADGTLATAGGMVVKNVTGYDTSKLHIGALGTLGIIVRANFKALPKPAAMRVAVAALADDVRDRAIAALTKLTIEPTATLLVDGFDIAPTRMSGAQLVVCIEGSAAAVERVTRELRMLLGKSGVAETLLVDDDIAAQTLQRAIDATIEALGDRSVTYRHLGAPVDVLARTDRVTSALRAQHVRCDAIADLRNGDAILRIAGADAAHTAGVLAAVDAFVRTALPQATLIAGDPDLRMELDAWGAPPTTLATQRALKSRFDPENILAPGRYVGGI